MEQPNQFTVKLKLKNHKLASSDLEDGSLQIGGSQKVMSQILIKVILPLVLTCTFFMSYFVIIFNAGLYLNWLLTIAVIGFLLTGVQAGILQKKISKNKSGKIIGKGFVHFGTFESSELVLNSSDVKRVIAQTELSTKETFEGQVLLEDEKSKRHLLLSIFDDNKRLLKEDLDYFKRFVELKLAEQ
ncbi:MAG: hypothetical protein ACI857_000688 [Arenicella sp.]|jgi:hypothetical protein